MGRGIYDTTNFIIRIKKGEDKGSSIAMNDKTRFRVGKEG